MRALFKNKWRLVRFVRGYLLLLLLPLLLSHFSCVRLYATPQTAAHQAPLSLGLSRQEHWSSLPFTSPMHESEKWKWSQLLSRVWLLATPWTAAYQASPSLGYFRQEDWSGLTLPSPKRLFEPIAIWMGSTRPRLE